MTDLEADLLIANAKIKQLEQELADMTAQRDALKISNDGLCFSHQTVSEQLAESQRREQAAVKQIEQKMIFDAGMGREPCEICANAEKTPCIHCEPKWRGPVAGEGDAK